MVDIVNSPGPFYCPVLSKAKTGHIKRDATRKLMSPAFGGILRGGAMRAAASQTCRAIDHRSKTSNPSLLAGASGRKNGETSVMVKVTYEVVQHDGGWAYKLADVYSEAFPSHSDALQAARIVAAEQQVGGEAAEISYQDEKGRWHEEYTDGGDRPETEVVDAIWSRRPAAASPQP
jgi:hypothetical protein